MAFFTILDIVFMLLFCLFYAYQFFYIFWSLTHKPIKFTNSEPHRLAILISARNEENVIPHLLNSIHSQTYDKKLLDIYVVADNCSDHTADVSRERGAIVYERFDSNYIGKGYALDFLYKKIVQTKGEDYYDGFIVLDADNLLEPDYVEQMNKGFSSGYKILTSYRNSKNYGSNWISSGYSLWFLREARHLNNPRMILGTSCAISGTGFLFSSEVIKKNGGWAHHLLTEDIEFTIDNVTQGEKVGYCHEAVLYDEQPETFKQSWNQRLRWARGFYQVFFKYAGCLFKGMLTDKFSSCYDMAMTIMPVIVLTIASILRYIAHFAYGMIVHENVGLAVLKSFAGMVTIAYFMLFIVGLITIITEHKNILCSKWRMVLSVFTFPFFMFTYIPISIVAIFKRVKWTPIKHTVSKTIEDMKCKDK